MVVDLTGKVDRNWTSQERPYLRIYERYRGSLRIEGQIRVEPLDVDYSGHYSRPYKVLIPYREDGFDPAADDASRTDAEPRIDAIRQPTEVEKLQQIADSLKKVDENEEVQFKGEIIE